MRANGGARMPKTRSPLSSTYLRHRRWTAEDAKQALTALKQSALSPSAFAAREGLDAQRLWRCRRQLGAPAATAFEEIVRPDADARSSSVAWEAPGRSWTCRASRSCESGS